MDKRKHDKIATSRKAGMKSNKSAPKGSRSPGKQWEHSTYTGKKPKTKGSC